MESSLMEVKWLFSYINLRVLVHSLKYIYILFMQCQTINVLSHLFGGKSHFFRKVVHPSLSCYSGQLYIHAHTNGMYSEFAD